jgi:hypothetical protein
MARYEASYAHRLLLQLLVPTKILTRVVDGSTIRTSCRINAVTYSNYKVILRYMSSPRFDRIVPLVTLVLIGLGVVFLLELNTDLLIINLGEGLPTFQLHGRLSVRWHLLQALASS